jgi:uncharacterized protein YcbX
MRPVGRVEALFRYPIKSMAGEALAEATLGWHGVAGDRRLALRRVNERGGQPFLTASKLAELVLFTPLRRGDQGDLPTHVRTPEGRELEVFSEELAEEVGRRHGAPVQMLHLARGIFDQAALSVINGHTVAEVCRLGACPADVRRFRPNVLVRGEDGTPFGEDQWVGGVLRFGDQADAAAVTVIMPDERCVMIGLAPDSARASPDLLRAVVRENAGNAGVYCSVLRRGPLAVGQTVWWHAGGA